MIYSKQRESLLAALKSSPTHPTAEELYARLKADNQGLSLATVYRNLNQLAANGMVLKIPVPGAADRFDATLKEHFHLICRQCGSVTDIPADYVSVDGPGVRQNTGCELKGYDLIMYGVCKVCNGKAN